MPSTMERKPDLNVVNTLLNINSNLNSPHARNIYLKRANDEFDSGNIKESVFYQCESLCTGYRCKYLMNNNLESINTPQKITMEKDSKQCSFENPLLQYAAQVNAVKSKPNNLTFETDPKKGIETIRSFCLSLPKEWTVLQLCKSFNSSNSVSLKSEIIKAEYPIYLSVLKHPQSELYSDPICFKIKVSETLYTLFPQITEKLKNCANVLQSNADSKSKKKAYNMHFQSAETDIKQAIKLLKSAIGPWRCFFSGSAKSQSQSQAICKKVKEFCINHGLDTKQFIILNNLTRYVNDLSSEEINLACAELSHNEIVSNSIKEFLIDQRKDFIMHRKSYPFILIVDELLDHFFWEMLNEHQEPCRISSLYVLKSLYTKYADKISDGYLKLPINKGNWILNPDKNLNDMERRISSFIEIWKPKIDCSIDRTKPSADTITKYLKESDIFIYSGHGSGLQFFNGHKITTIPSHSVVFLFGCDSVRLNSDGWHSEMTGSHLYYFAAQCPAVIGTILLAFDRKMDWITSEILSAWIPTKNKNHWQSIDKNLWLKEGKTNFIKHSVSMDNVYSPKLTSILRQLRLLSDTYHSRVYYVYRGLPLWNTNVA